RLGEVPAGSQTLETRAIGYARDQRPVVLPAGGDTTVAITLTSVKHVLDTIHVTAERVYNRDSFGFERRKRLGGWGYFFDEADVRRRRPYDVFQFLYDVPSVRLWQQGFNRTIMMHREGLAGEWCEPELYIDGV